MSHLLTIHRLTARILFLGPFHFKIATVNQAFASDIDSDVYRGDDIEELGKLLWGVEKVMKWVILGNLQEILLAASNNRSIERPTVTLLQRKGARLILDLFSFFEFPMCFPFFFGIFLSFC